mmetsp:Transcript_26871/g.77782  ORF Transcript_26871/g.77782 Transcript_26871/m.77782 type:complete len:235 (+) Transcript_26871:203-907(+)
MTKNRRESCGGLSGENAQPTADRANVGPWKSVLKIKFAEKRSAAPGGGCRIGERATRTCLARARVGDGRRQNRTSAMLEDRKNDMPPRHWPRGLPQTKNERCVPPLYPCATTPVVVEVHRSLDQNCEGGSGVPVALTSGPPPSSPGARSILLEPCPLKPRTMRRRTRPLRSTRRSWRAASRRPPKAWAADSATPRQLAPRRCVGPRHGRRRAALARRRIRGRGRRRGPCLAGWP